MVVRADARATEKIYNPQLFLNVTAS